MKKLGEELFALFLNRSGLPYCYEPRFRNKSRRPDFLVNWCGTECFFDVKDREKKVGHTFTHEEIKTLGTRFVIPERDPPYHWIRNKIEKGRTKCGGAVARRSRRTGARDEFRHAIGCRVGRPLPFHRMEFRGVCKMNIQPLQSKL